MAETAQFTVIDVGNIEGRAYLGNADLEMLGLDAFDYVNLISEYEDFGGVQILDSDEVEVGTIAVDSGVLESSHLADGDIVRIEKAAVASGIRSLKLGIEPLEGQTAEEVVTYVAMNFDELTSVLRNRVMFRGLSIGWPDAECGRTRIRFLESDPALKEREIGVIDPTGREVEINITSYSEMGFNGVLLIDVSGSMSKQDMLVKNISGALEGLKSGLADSAELTSFLGEIEDGKNISRVNAAALATMLFLSLKIAKGWGEQVQVLTFAGDVEHFALDGQNVINCVGATKKAGIEGIVHHLVEKCQAGSGLTFLSGALQEAYDCIPSFSMNETTGRANPTMIVALTDGTPNKGNGLGVNPLPIVKKCAEEHPESILYCIGLGEADRLMLRKLGETGRGGSLMAEDMESLTQFYDTLAKNFQLAVKARATELATRPPG